MEFIDSPCHFVPNHGKLPSDPSLSPKEEKYSNRKIISFNKTNNIPNNDSLFSFYSEKTTTLCSDHHVKAPQSSTFSFNPNHHHHSQSVLVLTPLLYCDF